MISFIALLAVTLGTYNASSLSLAERGREIAILSMIGFTAATVRRVLIARALAQGTLAYGAGLLAAWAVATLQYSHAGLFILGIALSFEITPAQAAAGLAWTAALACAGAWLSTRSLLFRQTAEALRS
jgi:putative ABC transport system permease protein